MGRIKILALLAAVIILPALAWSVLQAIDLGRDFAKSADIGARYVAKMTCSCVYVVGRDIDACRAELPEATAGISVDVDDANRRVRASVLWFEATARYREAQGCKLDN